MEDKIVELVLKLGLPTAALVAIGWGGYKGVRAFWDFFKPHVDSVIDAHKTFLAVSGQAARDCTTHSQSTNDAITKMAATQEKIAENQSDFAKVQDKQTDLLEKISDAVVKPGPRGKR